MSGIGLAVGKLLGTAVSSAAAGAGSAIGAGLGSKLVGSPSANYASAYTLKGQVELDRAYALAEAESKKAEYAYLKEKALADTDYSVAAMKQETEAMKAGYEAGVAIANINRKAQSDLVSAQAQVAMQRAKDEGAINSVFAGLLAQRLKAPSPVVPSVSVTSSAPQVVEEKSSHLPIYIAVALAAGLILTKLVAKKSS